MTTYRAFTPPDWVLLEAAKRSGMTHMTLPRLRQFYGEDRDNFAKCFQWVCHLILRYEKQPLDRKFRCAREAAALHYEENGLPESANAFRNATNFDNDDAEKIDCATKAIILWEQGFGK
jgi:hypothetical protein